MADRQRTGIPAATPSLRTDDPNVLRSLVECVVPAVRDAEVTGAVRRAVGGVAPPAPRP